MSLRDFLTFIAKLVGQSSDYALDWINHFVFSAGIAKFYVFKFFPLDSDLPVDSVIQTRIACHLGKTRSLGDKLLAKRNTHNIEPCTQELAEGFHELKRKQSSEKSYTRYLKVRQSI